MSRLEDVAIAALRSRMLKSDLREIFSMMHEIKKDCKGGNEHMEYTSSLLRDVYAYVIIKWFFLFDCNVFGGFVASHVNGKTWNDIDIMTPMDMLKNDDITTISQRLVKYLRFVFALSSTCIQVKQLRQKVYAKTIQIDFTDDCFSFNIPIDIIELPSVSYFIPVSVGRCLLLSEHCILKRRIPNSDLLLSSWECEDILGLLRQGKDVGLAMNCDHLNNELKQTYSRYFWTRIKTLQKSGYVIDCVLGEILSEVG